jgi:hypothetical protein
MQHDTFDILFSLFKMTLNLKGSVDQEFSFIVKIKKKTLFVTYSNKINIFCFSSMRRLKRHTTRLILSPFLVTQKSIFINNLVVMVTNKQNFH